MESCLYKGVVHHERLRPVNHRFHYRLYMAFLDLTEVSALIRAGLISAGRFGSNCFLRRDHFGPPGQPLEETVRDLVQARTGARVDGPIRLLTQLRSFGYYFSPLNLFFCYSTGGHAVQAIVAEVQNTPWLERHCYVLWAGNQDMSGVPGAYCHRKAFHVSPFLGMDMEYRWRLDCAGEHLRVGIDNTTEDSLVFRAVMQLHRSPLTRRSLIAMQCHYPVMAARITAAIYFQAFQLWRKKCPFYPHPKYLPVNTRLPSSDERPAQESSIVSVEAS